MKHAMRILFLIALLIPFNGLSPLNAQPTTTPSITGSNVKGGVDQSGNYFLESSNMFVRFDGKNPHVSFFLKADNGTTFPTFYKIMFSSLNETTSEGIVVNNYRLEQAFWDASQPVETIIDNTTVITLNFTTVLKVRANLSTFVDVPVTISTYMYSDTREVTLGNESLLVPSGSFKFSLILGAWPFASLSNELTFSIKLISNVNAAFTMHRGQNEVNSTSSDGLQFTMSNPQTAITDGNYTSINSSLSTYRGMTFLNYVFPAFTEYLEYDPVVSLAQGGSGDTGNPPGSGDAGNPPVGGQPSTLEFEGTTVKILFEGTTPHVKLFLKDGNFTSYYKIIYASINETDSTGGLVKYWRLETSQWSASEVKTLNIDSTDAINVNFTTTMTVRLMNGSIANIPMQINTYFFLGSTTLTYGNQSFTVPSGSFKYTFNIGAWPFASTENTININVQILSNVKARMNYDDKQGKLESENDEGVKMSLENPDIAYLDGVLTNISSRIISAGGRTYISYTFPYYETSLYYDPIVTLSATTSGTNEDTTVTTGESGGFVPSLTFGITVISLLLIPITIRKRKSQS